MTNISLVSLKFSPLCDKLIESDHFQLLQLFFIGNAKLAFGRFQSKVFI